MSLRPLGFFDKYDPRAEASAIRSGLRSGYDGVKMACFNESESEEIAAFLTAEERARTSFSWLFPKAIAS